jgi:hypothetical protein
MSQGLHQHNTTLVWIWEDDYEYYMFVSTSPFFGRRRADNQRISQNQENQL